MAKDNKNLTGKPLIVELRKINYIEYHLMLKEQVEK